VHSAHSRRAVALGTTTVAALLVAGAAALPAQADSLQLTVSGPSALALHPAGQPGSAGPDELFVSLGKTGAGTPHNVKLLIDATGLAGIAETGQISSESHPCPVQNGVYTCSIDSASVGGSAVGLYVAAAQGAKLGASGRLHLTVTSDNAGSAGLDSTISVGGAKLTVDGAQVNDNTKPGDTVTPGFIINNSGQLAGGHTVVTLMPTTGLAFTQKYANCQYGTARRGVPDDLATVPVLAICTIDTGIPVGQTVHLDPVAFKVTDSAYAEYLNVHASTDGAEDAYLHQYYDFAQGSGPRLTLGRPEKPSTDTVGTLNDGDRDHLYSLTADNHASFAAFAGWAPTLGSDGKQGTLAAGLGNDGPAGIFQRTQPQLAGVLVKLPQDVTVNSMAKECSAAYEKNSFLCKTPYWIPVGFRANFLFNVSVADPSANPVATISLNSADNDTLLPWDKNTANHTVTIPLGAQPVGNPSPSPSATPTPSATASAATPVSATSGPSEDSTDPAVTSAGNSGQQLAFTGGGSSAAPIAAAGGGAVLIGAGALLYARRRKAASRA
jgi:hypothetical protein